MGIVQWSWDYQSVAAEGLRGGLPRQAVKDWPNAQQTHIPDRQSNQPIHIWFSRGTYTIAELIIVFVTTKRLLYMAAFSPNTPTSPAILFFALPSALKWYPHRHNPGLKPYGVQDKTQKTVVSAVTLLI